MPSMFVVECRVRSCISERNPPARAGVLGRRLPGKLGGNMSRAPRHKVDRHVSPNWKPVESLRRRGTGLAWSDRVWYWLVSLGGLAMIGAGVAVIGYFRLAKLGGWLIGIGFVVFILGSPSQAARNGYRSS